MNRLVPLGDCCEIVSGATPRTDVPGYWDGDIAWATPADLSKLEGAFLDDTPRRITAAGLGSCGATVLPAGSVLLSSRAPIGHVAINSRPMATNQGFKSLIPRRELADAKYLYHWLRAKKTYLQSLGNGATFKEVSKAVVARVEVPLPPLQEQQRIAAILDEAEALRAKRRLSLAQVGALQQSIFFDMFGDPVESPKSKQIRILADWVPDSAPITYGILKPGPDVIDGVPYVRVVDIQDGQVLPGSVRRTSREIDAAYARSRLLGGDLIISIRGHVGRLGVVPDELAGGNITQDSARIRVSPGAREYVAGALNAPGLQRWMAKRTKGAAVQGINLTDLRMAPIPVANDGEMAEYGARMHAVRHLHAALTPQLDAAESLYAALQDSAFVTPPS